MEGTEAKTPDQRIDELGEEMLRYIDVHKANQDRQESSINSIKESLILCLKQLDRIGDLGDRLTDFEDRMERQERGFE